MNNHIITDKIAIRMVEQYHNIYNIEANANIVHDMKTALQAVFDHIAASGKMVESQVIKDFVDMMEKKHKYYECQINDAANNSHDRLGWCVRRQGLEIVLESPQYQALKGVIKDQQVRIEELEEALKCMNDKKAALEAEPDIIITQTLTATDLAKLKETKFY